MTPKARRKLQDLLTALIGLELWLTGESALPATADDDLALLHLRLVVYQTVIKQIRKEEGEDA